MTWRLLQVLVDHLPPESACKTAVRDETDPAELAALPKPSGHGPWSAVEMRLADLYDQLSWLIYATYHSQGGKPKKPKPLPRPGVVDKGKPRKVTPEGIDYLQRLRGRQGAARGDVGGVTSGKRRRAGRRAQG